MFTRTTAEEMLRGTTPSSPSLVASPCLVAYVEETKRHQGNLDTQIPAAGFRW